MVSEFDHLVLGTPDLAATVTAVAAGLGVAPVEGGRHTGFGTRNYLLGLGNGGYLEIIGVDPEQPDPEFPRPFGVDELAVPRLVAWAVRVTDIDGVVAAARTAGFDPGDSAEMSRATPDGQLLRWRLTRPGTGAVPFLIDWGATRHPSAGLPAAELRSLTAIHPDPDTVSAQLRALSADLTVERGLGPALIATLAGPAGTLTLL